MHNNFLYAHTLILRGVGWKSPPCDPHWDLPFVLSLHTIIISILAETPHRYIIL